jgi:hypothetical protein
LSGYCSHRSLARDLIPLDTLENQRSVTPVGTLAVPSGSTGNLTNAQRFRGRVRSKRAVPSLPEFRTKRKSWQKLVGARVLIQAGALPENQVRRAFRSNGYYAPPDRPFSRFCRFEFVPPGLQEVQVRTCSFIPNRLNSRRRASMSSMTTFSSTMRMYCPSRS